MNHDVLEFSNAIAGGTVSTQDVVARAAERIQSWFGRPTKDHLDRELNVRLEERHRERARIARELHDTLFQGFLGASMQLHNAVEQMPADSPSRPSISRALSLMQRVLDEGRLAVQGLRSSRIVPETLEEALSRVRDEPRSAGPAFRVFVTGKSRALKPDVQEQIYLIGREALVNALRHSHAASIEVEIEYLPRQLRMMVRDDGCGIDPQYVRSGRDGHWGLLGMHERAGSIGAGLKVWSKLGCGTEIEVRVPGDIVETCD
jgi:signal transduction histidine kinase